MMKILLALFAFLALPSMAFALEIAIIPRAMYDKFQTGDFAWTDILSFGFHLIELMLTVAGSIAVILVMVGGYQYIIGALTESKEQGKTTIKNALIGFAVILLAWIIVDIAIALITTP